MTSPPPRGPQSQPPAEPGWWLASDGMWYPPELASTLPDANSVLAAPNAGTEGPTTPAQVPPVVEPSAGPAEAATLGAPEAQRESAAVGTPTEPPAPPSFGAPPAPSSAFGDAPLGSPPPPFPGATGTEAESSKPRGNKAAVAALVLGVLSLLAAVTALPAIICGIIGVRRPNRRWMAVVGLVLGSVFLVAWILAAVAIPVYLNASATSTSGSAPVSSYDITIDECKLTATGLATVSGTLTNRTKKAKSFEIVVTMTDKESNADRRTSVTLSQVPSKGAEEYRTEPEEFPRSARAITCRVVDVRNAT